MTPRTLRRAVSLVLAGALALTVTACGSGDDGAPASARDRGGDVRRSPDASPSPTPRPEEPGELGAPAKQRPSGDRTKVAQAPVRPRGNALTVRATGADAHLVTPSALGRRWRERSTADEGSRVMSPCHAATFHDVGADRVRLRDFGGPGEAVQAAARFVDHRSALRIERVVRAWERGCAADLDDRDAALGVVRHGRWLAVVEVADVARPDRQVRRALDAAAATF
ncbi:hypothetical protein GCM10009623_27250 [Nocardioides aestuarii]|uniref:Sensor domain-containing protein n=1 Tax=Nocardioides aestuarii TaxID=252231 RepID=A0ABW4TQ32_9ACTN